jgi:hypothetical protein
VAGFPLRRHWFDMKTGHVGFVMDKASLGQIFYEYLFPLPMHKPKTSAHKNTSIVAWVFVT